MNTRTRDWPTPETDSRPRGRDAERARVNREGMVGPNVDPDGRRSRAYQSDGD